MMTFFFGLGADGRNWEDGDNVLGEATCGGSAVLHGRRISFFSFSLSFPLSLFSFGICFLNLKNGAGWRLVGEVFGSTVTKLSSFLL